MLLTSERFFPVPRCSTFSPLFGRQIDANEEILTTVGAAEALLLAIMALVNPGDEVIMLEPYFDFYPAQVKMAGMYRQKPKSTRHGGVLIYASVSV